MARKGCLTDRGVKNFSSLNELVSHLMGQRRLFLLPLLSL